MLSRHEMIQIMIDHFREQKWFQEAVKASEIAREMRTEIANLRNEGKLQEEASSEGGEE